MLYHYQDTWKTPEANLIEEKGLRFLTVLVISVFQSLCMRHINMCPKSINQLFSYISIYATLDGSHKLKTCMVYNWIYVWYPTVAASLRDLTLVVRASSKADITNITYTCISISLSVVATTETFSTVFMFYDTTNYHC